MHTRIRRSLFVPAIPWVFAAIALSLAAGRTALAESAPPRDVSHLATQSEINTSQRADIRRYVEYWSSHLATGEPRAVREAYRKLTEPLGVLGVRPIFRHEYSLIAVPALDRLLGESSNHQVAHVAIRVVGDIGSEAALELLVDRSDYEHEPRTGVRLWAARGFQASVRGDLGDAARRVPRLVRRLGEAAQKEPDWLVLYRQFEALAAAPGAESLTVQLDVLKQVVEDIRKGDEPSPRMQAVRHACVQLLRQYMEMDTRTQREMGERAGPVVGLVLRAAEAHWEAAQADETSKAWYHGAVRSAETFLMHIDAHVRSTTPVSTTLHDVWQRGNADAFQRQVQQWTAVLTQRPYRQ